jgi:hypothetical protein
VNEFRFDSEKLKGFAWLQKPEDEWCRLYFKVIDPQETGHGFEFVSFEVTSTNANGKAFEDGSDTCVEFFVHGIAYFDGVRHLYFGHEKTENDGYFNYPDLERLKWVINQIELLTKTCCRFPEG